MLVRRTLTGIARLAGVLAIVIVAFWIFAPVERIKTVTFPAPALPADLDGYLREVERDVPQLRPGAEKRIVWAGEEGTQTALSVVYLHGFSASSEEIRPVPDLVAQELGANLFFTRLAGHGQDGNAMGRMRVDDWLADVGEALAIGRRLGARVLVIATSTGGTLATLAASNDQASETLAGVVLVSPNYALRNRIANTILRLPGLRWWGEILAGPERSFEPVNAAHAQYWTTRYPSSAVFPMAAAMRSVHDAELSAIDTPALFLISEQDQVVSPDATRDIAAKWGGPVELRVQDTDGDGVDPYGHVIAGDILSPALTQPVVDQILEWVRGL